MNTKPDKRLVEYLKKANRIFVFTGAGVSTGSGIPDFRGPTGVWKTRQPVTFQEFMASEEKRVEYWQWKLEGFDFFKNARPNQAHLAVTKLEEAQKLEMLVTQNVDGLHAKAGTSRKRLVEIHGTNGLVQCMTCMKKFESEQHYKYFEQNRIVPTCECGGYLKPATISFGQNLVKADMEKAEKAALNADLVISLGSTLSVYPAAHFPLLAAGEKVPYIIINDGVTDHDHLEEVTLKLERDLVELFPKAVEALI